MILDPLLNAATTIARFLASLLGLSREIRQGTTDRGRHGVPATPGARILAERSRPLELELLLISFDISLNRTPPEIGVWFHAVNYLRRPLTITSLQVTQFKLSGCPALENIGLPSEIQIPARRSRLVYCRRALADSEARVFANARRDDRLNASVNLACTARIGSKFITYGPLVGQGVNGWIEGLLAPSAGTR